MSMERQERATLRDTITDLQRQIRILEARLAVIRDCADGRCSLCLACLNAAHEPEEDQEQGTSSQVNRVSYVHATTGRMARPVPR